MGNSLTVFGYWRNSLLNILTWFEYLRNSTRNFYLKTFAVFAVVNLACYWWSSDKLPYPSTTALANNIGAGKRTVERSVKKMVDEGFLARGNRIDSGRDGVKRKEYDLSGFREMFETM